MIMSTPPPPPPPPIIVPTALVCACVHVRACVRVRACVEWDIVLRIELSACYHLGNLIVNKM